MDGLDEITKRLEKLEGELAAQKKILKNAFRLSIAVGLLSIFFVVLNLSILFTVAGGVAGTDKKLKALEERAQISQGTH